MLLGKKTSLIKISCGLALLSFFTLVIFFLFIYANTAYLVVKNSIGEDVDFNINGKSIDVRGRYNDIDFIFPINQEAKLSVSFNNQSELFHYQCVLVNEPFSACGFEITISKKALGCTKCFSY